MTATLAVRGGAVQVGGAFVRGDVVVDGALIGAVGDGLDVGRVDVGGPQVDATGCSVLPGFVDVQVNGAVGVDLTTEPQRIGEVAAFLPQCGVTAFMPTVITSSFGGLTSAIDAIHRWSPGEQPAARSLGVHVEGPFLSTLRSGAHPRRHLRPPSLDEVGTWGPGVAMVTLAPELPGALAVIERLVASGITVCAGHTEVDPRGMAAAAAAGATGVTHLFNAMAPMSARRPGAAGAALADAALLAGVIVDGIHVDPAMVALAWRLLGPSRFLLVSDAMAALGLPPGDFAIGETHVTVDDAGAARTADGVLAGSVLRFDAAVRNLIAFTGCALAEASVSASATPARLARRGDLGRLAPGCPADIVVLDEELRVEVTIVGGRVAFDPHGRSTWRW